MVVSTNEINLYRLLVRCEQRLNDKEEWNTIEKGKFIAYVRYLENLQHQAGIKNNYAERIEMLANAVASRGMNDGINKGITEARTSKKSLLDGLKQLQQPEEPEWLQKIKNAPDEDATAAARQKEEEEEKSDNESIILTSNNNKPGDKLRRRQGSGMTREEETSNIEHVLQHHRQMHDELTTDLGRMAQQLKVNSQSFGDTLAKDDQVLHEAQQAVVNNLDRLRKERQRLDTHYSKSWGTSFMTMGVVLFVCIMFVLVFFTIKLLPKA
ncbi:vesicle transport protein [Zychaea mexicana]|uniref:vesicle transport protein n=1 Tax=Zychaea mexicana TaxID=64656 RepID=UPI0022FEA67C|nr:vesicle transport protein [Zychaea mexicana]KAI9498378.1 vesicle transport protein [Zychaea mexicana]